MTVRTSFRGSFTALVTPFTSTGALDEAAVRRLAGLLDAAALTIEQPAMVQAAQAAVLQPPIGEVGAAMRAAKRLGDDYVSIVKACSAVKGDADKALGKLNDVPEEARADLGAVMAALAAGGRRRAGRAGGSAARMVAAPARATGAR